MADQVVDELHTISDRLRLQLGLESLISFEGGKETLEIFLFHYLFFAVLEDGIKNGIDREYSIDQK